MKWRSMIQGASEIDTKEDLKRAVSYGAFRIGDQAVYLNGREYLPLEAVKQAKLYASRLNSHGCCGLSIPVWYVLLYHGGETPLKLLTETKEKAERALAALTEKRPEIEVLD